MRQDRAVSFVNNHGLAFGEISLVRIKRLAKEFLWVGLGQAAAALGGLAGVSLLTRALTPELYGELALGMTVATLTQQAVLGPVSGALIRFFAPAMEAGQLNAYLKGARHLVTWATFVVLGLGAVLALVLSRTGQVNSIGLMITAFLFSLLSGYSSAMDGVQNAARQRAVVAWLARSSSCFRRAAPMKAARWGVGLGRCALTPGRLPCGACSPGRRWLPTAGHCKCAARSAQSGFTRPCIRWGIIL